MTMQTESDELFDESIREGLGRVLDVLLPGTDRLPSGREAGAHLAWLDRVLAADPRPLQAMRELGAQATTSDECTLGDIEDWAGGELEPVVFALNAAYYISPLVTDALGYPGQTRRPVSQATPEELCSEELIAPVRARGAIYVPTPD